MNKEEQWHHILEQSRGVDEIHRLMLWLLRTDYQPSQTLALRRERDSLIRTIRCIVVGTTHPEIAQLGVDVLGVHLRQTELEVYLIRTQEYQQKGRDERRRVQSPKKVIMGRGRVGRPRRVPGVTRAVVR